MDQGSLIMDHGSRIMDQGSWIMNHGSRIMDQGSWIMDQGSLVKDHGSWIKDHGSRILFWHEWPSWKGYGRDIKTIQIYNQRSIVLFRFYKDRLKVMGSDLLYYGYI